MLDQGYKSIASARDERLPAMLDAGTPYPQQRRNSRESKIIVRRRKKPAASECRHDSRSADLVTARPVQQFLNVRRGVEKDIVIMCSFEYTLRSSHITIQDQVQGCRSEESSRYLNNSSRVSIDGLHIWLHGSNYTVSLICLPS
jgi:hypothetical protein